MVTRSGLTIPRDRLRKSHVTGELPRSLAPSRTDWFIGM
jgi:hypothetical protein